MKVSVAFTTISKNGLEVGIFTGTDRPPATAVVDMGYRGAKAEGARILRFGQSRGITKTLKVMSK